MKRRFKLFCIIVGIAFACVLIMSSCTSKSALHEAAMFAADEQRVADSVNTAYIIDSIKSNVYTIEVYGYSRGKVVYYNTKCAIGKQTIDSIKTSNEAFLGQIASVDSVYSNIYKLRVE